MKSGSCPEKEKNKTLNCLLCNKVFPFQSRLNRHMKSGDCPQNEKTYSCLQCGKDFPFRSRFVSHMLKEHDQIVDTELDLN